MSPTRAARNFTTIYISLTSIYRLVPGHHKKDGLQIGLQGSSESSGHRKPRLNQQQEKVIQILSNSDDQRLKAIVTQLSYMI